MGKRWPEGNLPNLLTKPTHLVAAADIENQRTAGGGAVVAYACTYPSNVPMGIPLSAQVLAGACLVPNIGRSGTYPPTHL